MLALHLQNLIVAAVVIGSVSSSWRTSAAHLPLKYALLLYLAFQQQVDGWKLKQVADKYLATVTVARS